MTFMSGGYGRFNRYETRLKKAKSLQDLPEPILNLFNLVVLLTDIEFKHERQKTLDQSQGQSYGVHAMKEALPDQIILADDTLEGSHRRGLPA
jgi:hypothetical protein